MAFVAKYRSRCPNCHASIEAGQEIEAKRGQKARHADCTRNAKDEAATQRTVAYVQTMGKWLRDNPEPTVSGFAVEHGAPKPDLDGCLTSEEKRFARAEHSRLAMVWLERKGLMAVFEVEHAGWERKRVEAEKMIQARGADQCGK
jgi:hypothetical protein